MTMQNYDRANIYVPFSKVQGNEDGTCDVYGVVSTADVDLDGQITDPDFFKSALQSWFKDWGNIREMHQPIAVGVATEIDFNNDESYLGAHIVDPLAVKKCLSGTYKGFSYGLKSPVVQMDPSGKARRGIVKGGVIVENSLVDYPANPNAKILMVKMADNGRVLYDVSTADGDFVTVDKDILADAIKAALADTKKEVGFDPAVPSVLGMQSYDQDSRKCMGCGADLEKDADVCAKCGMKVAVEKREFSEERRQELADQDRAMPDGSYPIVSRKDLSNALQSVGRAKDPAAAKAHIIRRAKALDATDMLPADWPGSTKDGSKKSASSDANKTIREENGKFVLYTKDGSRKLGTHDTYAEAAAQESAIEHRQSEKMGAPAAGLLDAAQKGIDINVAPTDGGDVSITVNQDKSRTNSSDNDEEEEDHEDESVSPGNGWVTGTVDTSGKVATVGSPFTTTISTSTGAATNASVFLGDITKGVDDEMTDVKDQEKDAEKEAKDRAKDAEDALDDGIDEADEVDKRARTDAAMRKATGLVKKTSVKPSLQKGEPDPAQQDVFNRLQLAELDDAQLALFAANIVRYMMVRELHEQGDPDESMQMTLTTLGYVYDCLVNFSKQEAAESWEDMAARQIEGLVTSHTLSTIISSAAANVSQLSEQPTTEQVVGAMGLKSAAAELQKKGAVLSAKSKAMVKGVLKAAVDMASPHDDLMGYGHNLMKDAQPNICGLVADKVYAANPSSKKGAEGDEMEKAAIIEFVDAYLATKADAGLTKAATPDVGQEKDDLIKKIAKLEADIDEVAKRAAPADAYFGGALPRTVRSTMTEAERDRSIYDVLAKSAEPDVRRMAQDWLVSHPLKDA